MRKLVVFTVITTVTFTGLMGYVWYDTRTQARRLLDHIKPFAEIGYGSIYVSPFGSARVNKINISPYASDAPLRLERITVKGINIFSLLHINNALAQNRLPKALHLSFQRFQIASETGLFENIFAMTGTPALLNNLPCGETNPFNHADLERFGYDSEEVNAQLYYSINELKPSMQLRLRLNYTDTTTAIMVMEADFTLTTPWLSVTEPTPASMRLTRLTASFADNSFVRALNRLCAEREAMAFADYMAAQIAVLNQRLLTQGTDLDHKLISAYEGFVRTGEPITLTAIPDNPIDISKLKNLEMDDLVEGLNLKLGLNHRADASLSWEFHKSATSEHSKKKLSSDRMKLAAETNPQRYPELSSEKIYNHLGSMVIIYTTTGGKHEGILEAVDHDSIELIRPMQGGSITFILKLNEIEKVLVVQ